MPTSISETIVAKSDQLNSDDLAGGPRTFTVAAVRKVSDEQPIHLTLAEWIKGRPYKPGLSMRRVLLNGWGDDIEQYVGRRLTLYRDATVRFGGQDVGGIRISHMSDLPGGRQLKSALTVTRGKKETYTVKPLTDEPTKPRGLDTSGDLARSMYAAVEAAGIDKADALARIGAIIGRTIAGAAEMTEDEARAVVAALEVTAEGAEA